jgi:predicted phosphodiesterase
MIFTLIADTHKFAPHALDIDIPLDPAVIERENIWLLGDIVDLKGCDQRDKERCLNYYNALCKAYGRRYIKGNHDGEPVEPFIELEGYIILTHGDIVCWTEEKAMAFRNMQKFQGYGCFKSMINWARHLWKQRINKVEVEQGTALLNRWGKKIIVYGHSHTTKVLMKKVKDKVLVNIPRGITVIDL